MDRDFEVGDAVFRLHFESAKRDASPFVGELPLPGEHVSTEFAFLVRPSGISGGSGYVVIFRVLADGPMGGILGRETSHALAHSRYPLCRNSCIVALMEIRYDVPFQKIVN